MKKLKVFILSLTIFLTCLLNVRAECSLEESSRLSTLGANVKVDYEVIEKEIEKEAEFNTPDGLTDEEIAEYQALRTFFRIYITNITEDLYVEVQDKDTKERNVYTYANAVNGVISFDQEVYTFLTNYIITVYSSDKTGCPNTKLNTLYLTTPMYNSLSESVLCEGIENFYLCNPYLPVEVSFENYETMMENYRQGKIDNKGEVIDNENETKNFIGFIKENKNLIIATVVFIVVVGGLVTVIIVKKQRSRVI